MRRRAKRAASSQIRSGESSSANETSSDDSPRDTDVARKEGELANARSQLSRYRQLIGRLKKSLKAKDSAAKFEQDEAFAHPFEDLVRTGVADVEERTQTLRIPWSTRLGAFLRLKGLHSSYDCVLRQDLRVVVRRIHLRVETLSEPGTGKTLRADTSEVGPAGSKLTWQGLALLSRLAVEYALPLERLSKLFGHGAFSDSQLFRWLYDLASSLLPIYLYLAEALAESRYLLGDDSATKVIGMQRSLQSGEFGHEKEGELDPLVEQTADVLGRLHHRKDQKGQLKSKLQVSFVCGKEDLEDSRSYIFFFRTHFGSCGNLLSKLLSMRRRRNKKITVQGDLSTTNFASDLYYTLFDLSHVGCGAHGRRDIWRYRDQDEQICGFLLRAFALLNHVEKIIDKKGRTKERILKYRNKYSRKIWRIIYQTSKSVTDHKSANYWPKSSKIYVACQYLVTHCETKELLAYLDDANLFLTNNLCERMLRGEKMLLVACKFRQTERGRVVFDILRTILMTSAGAKINVGDYLKWVVQNKELVSECPEKFTPFAYARKMTAKTMAKCA